MLNLISICEFLPGGFNENAGASFVDNSAKRHYSVSSNVVISWAVFKILFYF